MARTINEIQNGMLMAIASNEVLALQLTSTSKAAIFRLFVFIVASAIWLLEMLFDNHNKEVQDIIKRDKAHRPSWYKTKALSFQYGFALISDTDEYNNTGHTEEEILNSKVIKYAAVTSSGGQLSIKIATETAGILSPIAPEVKSAFEAYILEIADCGVKYLVVNHLPDILLLNLKIFINPLVLDSTGMSILNGNYPVQDAINEYMKELPFDGELVLAHLIDKLQKAEGVVIPHLINAESQSIDINTNVYNDAQPINVKTIPESGYFTIPNFDNISYVV
ncbi:nucleotidyltransferase [Flavobacterium laiguense]|uniref:Nucleotidyltransferase n=1 Tax=Flavobacterium laiguense TaxID=2169409 RepID=A0A2U1JKS3_9FLAO|nr:nucleotidyltransferase [Flavobacterium laiguense]PWA05478.1 nucleotidyltransferase [Flavobacterium laiguense]